MKNVDTYSYKGWLLSDSLIKRSLAVWGHYLFAGLIFFVGIIALSTIFALVFGIGSAFTK